MLISGSDTDAKLINPPSLPCGPAVLRARRYRRWLPAGAALIVFSGLEPLSPEDKFFDALTIYGGGTLCMLGQWLRLWAWGCNAFVGKSGVRDRGPYALMRHPLYAGNFLILLGLTVAFNNHSAYPLLLVPFAYLYILISRADELRMKARYGAGYEAYARTNLSRFLPRVSNLSLALGTTTPFNWVHAWRKEYNSCCAWLAGIGSLKIYRDVLAYDWQQALHHNRGWLLVIGICAALAIGLNLAQRIGRYNSLAAAPTTPAIDQVFIDHFNRGSEPGGATSASHDINDGRLQKLPDLDA